jgi:hypothetical protein
VSASAPGAVLINEVAWAGTAASSSDEWIELFNPGASPVSLAGWTLDDGGDIAIVFPAGLTLAPRGYLLLERTDDAVVSDVAADLVYSGGLANGGETLTLRDGLGNVIDLAAGAGGWPAGDDATFATMERAGAGWRTHAGAANGHDADGAPLRGTPRGPNSHHLPTPTPQAYPATVRVNEVLPSPGDGVEEFVEIVNTSGAAVDVSGWKLDDAAGGSAPHVLPPGTVLGPGAFLAVSHTGSGLTFNNTGDSARLLYPDDRVADEFAYDRDPGENVSWARVPDGGAWALHGAPSPGASNGAGAPVHLDGDESGLASDAVPIGTLRTWPAGAWATISGRVTVPPALFSKRLIYLQDDTGGIAVYLGRGDWPALAVGQRVTVFGNLRLQSSGQLQLYVRNLWHVGVEPLDGGMPGVLADGVAGAPTAGALVTVTGRVVRLESTAFWLEAGGGPVRVFFASTTGLKRPRVARGDVWSVTGVVVEMSATTTRAAGYQLQPRFASDVQPVSVRYPQSVETTSLRL